jgi:hypothetical protein
LKWTGPRVQKRQQNAQQALERAKEEQNKALAFLHKAEWNVTLKSLASLMIRGLLWHLPSSKESTTTTTTTQIIGGTGKLLSTSTPDISGIG